MTLRRTLLAGAALCAIAIQANASELRGTYASIEGGAGWIGNESISRTTAVGGIVTASALYNADFDTGWALFGALGYGFDNAFRAELELGYRQNEIDRFLRLSAPAAALTPDGDLGQFTVMANLLYDIPLGSRLTFSIGAGIGANKANFDAAALGLDDDEWVLAYQGIAGLSYAIGDQTQLFVNYRYLHTDAPEFSVATAPNTVQHTAFLSDFGGHTATFGLRFMFDGGRPHREEMAPPPPPPSQPAPPPPAASPPQFIVFFGHDSADLVPEALRVIADAASAAKEFGAASLQVAAHTDSSGSPEYNQRLSERRANTVRAALVAQGIPADRITASAHGEDELLVRTDDGVKEPQNRRATIDMK